MSPSQTLSSQEGPGTKAPSAERLGKADKDMAQELLGFTQVSHEGKLASAGTACSGPFETSLENPTANLFSFGTTCSAWLCSAASPFLIVVCQTMSGWKTHLSPPVNLLKSIQFLKSNN